MRYTRYIYILLFVAACVTIIRVVNVPAVDVPAVNMPVVPYDVCIVGAGLSGAVIAERYTSLEGSSVYVMEKRDHIGGNVYDYIDEETGIRVNKYGAHLFHTQYPWVKEYMAKFSEWVKYEHKVVALIDNKHVPVPVNIDTVNALFNASITDEFGMNAWLKKEQIAYEKPPKNSEEMTLSRVGPRLYEMLFKPYTIKQWAKEPKELGPEVTARIPVRNNFDGRYFGDYHQALPVNGFTAIFEKMFSHPKIKVETNVDYFQVRDKLSCGRTYFTGPIDAYFAHLGWNKLEYRSLDFERKVVKNVDFFQPGSVVNHPSSKTDFTRIVEYKHILNQTSKDTILFYERSKDGGDPYYPVPNDRNKQLYEKYRQMALKEPGVTFVGRLANYKYFNMDQTVKNALDLFYKDTKRDVLPRVVIECTCSGLTGGPEAIVQLILAFAKVNPGKIFISDIAKGKENIFYQNNYPDILEIDRIKLTELRKGDVYIAPEGRQCNEDLIRRGVRMFMWQLGATGGNAERAKMGCRFISHNFWLSYNLEVNIPSNHVIRPYLTPSVIQQSDDSPEGKEDLILLDNDNPEHIKKAVYAFCKARQPKTCEVVFVHGFTRAELPKLFRRAKITIDWCMRGTERMPLEAGMNGALLVTSNCQCAQDRQDYPLPPKGIIKEAQINNTLEYLLTNFETARHDWAPLYKLYRNLNHETMAEEALAFLQAIGPGTED